MTSTSALPHPPSMSENDDPFYLLLRQRAVEARRKQGIPLSSQAATSESWPQRLPAPPSSQQFRDIVERHVPVLIQGCLDDRPQLAKWKDTAYLQSCMGPERSVVVALTPDGRADDLVEHHESGREEAVFALPLEQSMRFSELLDRLARQVAGNSDSIAYLQSQNSNLSMHEYGDLSPLLRDLEQTSEADASLRSDLAWATEAIGCAPEATNTWIGTSASRTSMHRDYYENIFSVVRGYKEFTVFPPSEACFLCDDDEYPIYRYAEHTPADAAGKKSLVLKRDADGAATRWIPIDPTLPKSAPRNAPYVHRDLNADAQSSLPSRPHAAHTKYGYALPALTIRVHEGEALYLPSGWFHHVAQQHDHQLVAADPAPVNRGLCLCINWWYQISDDVALQLDEMDLASGYTGNA
ncbi:hypothetical protein PaG_02056 [Moesziomyces aphidis]|uniref:JmjC domain-containing protein n=1 Tax=Moesziomyces aphidis TaxID=84754 RepID=W3VSI4_MOEAP|nr:hypothetical protein PaG_02056 [Moesziomyces aphidis]